MCVSAAAVAAVSLLLFAISQAYAAELARWAAVCLRPDGRGSPRATKIWSETHCAIMRQRNVAAVSWFLPLCIAGIALMALQVQQRRGLGCQALG